jgi:hypothetical protein
MAGEKRRTQVDAIDDLTAAVRLHTELEVLALPVSVLKHDQRTYQNPATQAAVDEKNERRAVVRAALGWEH